MNNVTARWQLSAANREQAVGLAQECSIPPLIAYLCVSRGLVTADEIQSFTCANPALGLDPFSLPNMDKAVERLNKALDSGEIIAVFGDYDTDGVCAAALIARYLEARGAIVTVRLPDRQLEGYGVTSEAVQELFETGVSLIVTVDNGISAYEAADRAQELGVDLIITDHHSPGDKLPKATAIVNAKLSDCTAHYREYCGTGIAFLLACAIEGGSTRADIGGFTYNESVSEILLQEFGDIAAVATIGDVVPLTGENRILVRRGLTVLNNSPCIGLAALIEASGIGGRVLSAHDVAFKLSPRINAAGRMGSADDALRLILAEDEEEARELAQRLCEANMERQKIEKDIMSEALMTISEEKLYDPVVLLCGEKWHEGIIGIAAAKAAERYGKPAFVLSVNKKSDTGVRLKGSARSLEGFHIHKALTYCKDLLLYYGGHAMAGGLTMDGENLDALRERLNEYADKQSMPYPSIKIDARLTPAAIKPELLDAISLMAPFGCGNEEPVFALTGLTLKSITPMGEGKHLRLKLEKGGVAFTAALFYVGVEEFANVPGDLIDIAVSLSENIYRGERKLSVAVKGVRPSGIKQDVLLPALRRYESFKRSHFKREILTETDIPDRTFCAEIYKQLQHNPYGWNNIPALCAHIGDDGSRACAVSFALDILQEAELLKPLESGSCLLPKPDSKRDLNATQTMNALK